MRARLVHAARRLALVHASQLDQLKAEAKGLDREDFVWFYMLQSFATWGSSRGWEGLIPNADRMLRVSYPVLLPLPVPERIAQATSVFLEAKVRYPKRKAQYLSDNVDRLEALGGLGASRQALLDCDGRKAKVLFLSNFKGISKKYARNIMMDVYHPEFRDSIAIDQRIQKVTEAMGLSFDDYEEHERYLLSVAHDAALEGWELDRLLYHHRDAVISAIRGDAIGTPPPQVQVLTDTSATLAAHEALVNWAEDIEVVYVGATSTAASPGDCAFLEAALPKTRRAVLGAAMPGTATQAILRDLPGDRLVLIHQTLGASNPNLTLGVRGTEFQAMVGSSPLPSGTLCGLNVWIRGTVHDRTYRELAAFVDGCWAKGRAATKP